MQAPETTPLETKLLAALRANATLRAEAEGLVAAYIEPNSDRPAIIDQLIRLFDGPQREAHRLSERGPTREQRLSHIARQDGVMHRRDIV